MFESPNDSNHDEAHPDGHAHRGGVRSEQDRDTEQDAGPSPEAGAATEPITLDVLCQALNAGGVSVWNWDFERGCVDLTPAKGETIAGFDRCRRLSVGEWFHRVHPQDEEFFRASLEEFVLGNVTEWHCECRLRGQGDSWHWVYLQGSAGRRNRAGKALSMLGTARKTDLRMKRMRKGLEAFFHLTPDLMGAFDFKGGIRNLSPSWTSCLGWTAEMLINEGIEAVVHPEDRSKMRKLLNEVVHSDGIEKIENRVVSRKGETFWYAWRIFADQSTATVFLSACDVTHRKEAERALIEAKTQAEEASQAKSDFLAVMSHELRTPLNPILGFTDFLMEAVEEPEHRAILSSISEAGENLTAVIGDVLDFAKIESGRTEVKADVFNLGKTIDKQMAIMAGQLKGKPVRLHHRVELSAGIEEADRFIGDEEKIVRVVSNLVGNGIKFTDAGEVHLDASVDLIDGNRVMLHVDVRDTGIGIAESTLEELFKPFKQADSSRTRRHGGTGLGLAICKKFIDLMGGKITVRSHPGEGSVFSFVVPLGLSKAEKKTVAPARKKAGGLAAMRLENAPHVLLVEDNATNTFYAKHLLRGMGCEVTAVASGEEALAQYTPDVHEVILLDLHMPGIGGMDVLKTIRENESRKGLDHEPILILTADVLPSTRAACLQFGADAVLSKPMRPPELKIAIENAMSQVV